MRSFAHWTPAYIGARVEEIIDHSLYPADPWLTREAIDLIERLLKPTDVAVEFGAGRSTRWIAQRVACMTSIESNPVWQARVATMLEKAGLTNVDLLLCPNDVDEERGAEANYVRVLDRFAPGSIDFVLVDGMYRGHCALGMVEKLRSGGVLVIDNVNWFLPSPSRSPTSRRLSDGPAGEVWLRFATATKNWRRIWTSSGVTDTLILFKP
jgi:predicted O-methyltransferase YrrM